MIAMAKKVRRPAPWVGESVGLTWESVGDGYADGRRVASLADTDGPTATQAAYDFVLAATVRLDHLSGVRLTAAVDAVDWLEIMVPKDGAAGTFKCRVKLGTTAYCIPTCPLWFPELDALLADFRERRDNKHVIMDWLRDHGEEHCADWLSKDPDDDLTAMRVEMYRAGYVTSVLREVTAIDAILG